MAWSDAKLVRMTLEGDRDAFGMLVDRHRRTIYALALQRGFQPAESEDLAQEVFIKAFKSLKALEDAAHFSRWLYGIAAHVCADGARRRQRRRRESTALDEAPEPAEPFDDRVALTIDEDLASVLRALQGLNEDQRIVVTLRYIDGLSPKEIAQRLDEPRGTVRSRLHHALQYLQGRLAPRGSAHLRPGAGSEDSGQKGGAQ